MLSLLLVMSSIRLYMLGTLRELTIFSGLDILRSLSHGKDLLLIGRLSLYLSREFNISQIDLERANSPQRGRLN